MQIFENKIFEGNWTAVFFYSSWPVSLYIVYFISNQSSSCIIPKIPLVVGFFKLTLDLMRFGVMDLWYYRFIILSNGKESFLYFLC